MCLYVGTDTTGHHHDRRAQIFEVLGTLARALNYQLCDIGSSA